jgi:hypothetical protein
LRLLLPTNLFVLKDHQQKISEDVVRAEPDLRVCCVAAPLCRYIPAEEDLVVGLIKDRRGEVRLCVLRQGPLIQSSSKYQR